MAPRERTPADAAYAWRFSSRKARLLRGFLAGASIRRIDAARLVPASGTLYLWGSQAVPVGIASGVGIVRIEDGFLRSVGLGADLVRPLSWVLDRSGIYYDASAPSDLERLISRDDRSDGERARAQALRMAIVAAQITKYNVGTAAWRRPAGSSRVLLVPGQVEDDASVVCSAGHVATNRALLQQVRRSQPSAYVVYKPHPDVHAGLRCGNVQTEVLARLCDEIVTDAKMETLLEHVDEVHTMTSLAGFEALLRGKPVTTYGMPFYAGWGLTIDRGMRPEVARRRQTRPSLDDLVAATLIEYPTYLCPSSGVLSTPERTLDALRAWRGSVPSGTTLRQRLARPFLACMAHRRERR